MELTYGQFYAFYAHYELISSEMELSIHEAFLINPERCFDVERKTIETIKMLKDVYHAMYHHQQTLDNQSGKVMKERDFLLKKIIKLEQENKNLKESLSLCAKID